MGACAIQEELQRFSDRFFPLGAIRRSDRLSAGQWCNVPGKVSTPMAERGSDVDTHGSSGKYSGQAIL